MVGHVEWGEFVTVKRVPHPGEIVHAYSRWEEPGGAGAVAAVQLARLAGRVTFFTAVGDDEAGHRSVGELRGHGVRVEAAFRKRPTRRVFVYLDSKGERTITVIGERMGPLRRDRLPWAELAGYDAVYFTAGDRGALRAARAARVLTSTPRALDVLAGAGVDLDGLIGSRGDAGERYRPGDVVPPPRLVVQTEGAAGGRYRTASGIRGRWAAAPLPGPLADTYGAGDTFAAVLTFGLAVGVNLDEAFALAARAGALCLTGRGPYGARLPRFERFAAGR